MYQTLLTFNWSPYPLRGVHGGGLGGDAGGWEEGWERTVDGMQILQKLVHYRYMYFFKINFQVV